MEQLTTKEKLEFIHQYWPGGLGEIAMKVPCHINTLGKIKRGEDNIRPIIAKRINEIYEQALQIRDIAEA